MKFEDRLELLIVSFLNENGINVETIKGLDLMDIGLDSIMFVSLIIHIETEFNIIIPDEFMTMERFSDFREIVKVIGTVIHNGDRTSEYD